jgi:alkylmercury lyase
MKVTALKAISSNADADTLLQLLPKAFFELSPEEQRVSLALYRMLAEGNPVEPGQLAAKVGMPENDVRQNLNDWPGVFTNDTGAVIGFWGLAVDPVGHRFTVDGRNLSVWCAWDAFFIPQLIGKTAHVASTCAVTKQPIELTIYHDGRVESNPPDAVISFLNPEAAKMMDNIVENFCHYILFFKSAEAGSQWVSTHNGTYLLRLADVELLSRRKNELQYRDALTSVRRAVGCCAPLAEL